MSTFKDLSPKETATRLLEIENPIIYVHKRPDADAVGSGCALCEIFRQLGKSASLLSEDPIPERLRFITDELDVSFSRDTEGKTPIAIDVASPSQLGDLYGSTPNPILMIDHHRVGERFADGYVDPDASSAAEALLDIVSVLENMGKISLTKRLAYALFAAISSDTGCFAYSNATAKAHRCAARLIETGIDFSDINHKLFTSKSKNQIRAEGYIASKIESDGTGRVAFATLSLGEIKQLGLNQESFETAIDVVRSLYGCEIAFVIKETESGKFKASLRSTGADVASVAAKFGGGGHIRAAGCTPIAENIEKAKDLVLLEILKMQDQDGKN